MKGCGWKRSVENPTEGWGGWLSGIITFYYFIFQDGTSKMDLILAIILFGSSLYSGSQEKRVSVTWRWWSADCLSLLLLWHLTSRQDEPLCLFKLAESRPRVLPRGVRTSALFSAMWEGLRNLCIGRCTSARPGTGNANLTPCTL